VFGDLGFGLLQIDEFEGNLFPVTTLGALIAYPVTKLLVFTNAMPGPVFEEQPDGSGGEAGGEQKQKKGGSEHGHSSNSVTRFRRSWFRAARSG